MPVNSDLTPITKLNNIINQYSFLKNKESRFSNFNTEKQLAEESLTFSNFVHF